VSSEVDRQVVAIEKRIEEFHAEMTRAQLTFLAIQESIEKLKANHGDVGLAASLLLIHKFLVRSSKFTQTFGDLSKPEN
jgi:hypothetical protein